MINIKNKLFHLIEKLKTRYYAHQKKQTISSIRDHFSFLGFDTNKFTDEEIEQGAVMTGKLLNITGATVAEASKAFEQLSKLMQEDNHDR